MTRKTLKLKCNEEADKIEKELNNFLTESKKIKSSCERITEAIKNFGVKTKNKIKELC